MWMIAYHLLRADNIYLEQQSKTDADILKLMNQKAMAEYIRSLLDNKSSHNQLLLVNSGINNTLIESQITLYNSTLLQMQSHLEYTSGQNPLIINLEKELSSLRKNILANVINHIRTIDIELKSLQDYHGLTSRKISSNPEHAKYLISIEREQKVKESLYVYLLQKKEENEISVSYKSAIRSTQWQRETHFAKEVNGALCSCPVRTIDANNRHFPSSNVQRDCA